MQFEATLDHARQMDNHDPLSLFRDKFYIPKDQRGRDGIYLCGNSLGLQPKKTQQIIQQELDDWASMAVRGHVKTKDPWLGYHELVTDSLAALCGAKNSEVVSMNSLTTNLHLMLVSFYRPNKDRYKILIEGNAFPSDRYAVGSQLKYHGYDPEEALVIVDPDIDNFIISDQKIIDFIERFGDEIAVVLLPGVQYLSGQVFDLKNIVEVAHRKGCVVGFDLAHAIGNILLELHDWQVDFAVWCSYKYLNSGPGGIAGCFIHQNHLGCFRMTLMTVLIGWITMKTLKDLRQFFDNISHIQIIFI